MINKILMFLIAAALLPAPAIAEEQDSSPTIGTAVVSDPEPDKETGQQQAGQIQPPAAELTNLEPSNWKGDGRIIGDKYHKQMISEGDIVYVNLGRDRIAEGSELQIFRRLGRIKNLNTGKPKYEAVATPTGMVVRNRFNPDMHFETRFIGTLRITGFVGLDGSTARILTSREPIYIGDWVKITRDGR